MTDKQWNDIESLTYEHPKTFGILRDLFINTTQGQQKRIRIMAKEIKPAKLPNYEDLGLNAPDYGYQTAQWLENHFF